VQLRKEAKKEMREMRPFFAAARSRECALDMGVILPRDGVVSQQKTPPDQAIHDMHDRDLAPPNDALLESSVLLPYDVG
jgi:hypothetical protein